MKKRLLSIVTTLALCLSLLPTAAFAEEHTCADGDVTDHYCDTCWEHIPTLCADEDSDHLCDVCSDTLSECVDDVDHDHWCDTCGDVTYRTDPLDSGYYACEAGCGAVMVSVTGDYTELNYHGLEEGTLVDGKAEISVRVPKYQSETLEFVENGTVTIFWTDVKGEIFENHTIKDVELVDGKATVSFTDLPIELLHQGNLLYKPANATYLPESNGMVLKYQDNAYRLSVDSNVDCTINGVYEDSLYLFSGTEVSVNALPDASGTLTWSYDEDGDQPKYEVSGSRVHFTMPEGDVYATLDYACFACVDKDGDHRCDFCDSIVGLPGAPTLLSAEWGNRSVTVEWEAPENNGFPEILYYVVTAEQNGIGLGKEVEATGDTMTYTMDGLLNGQTYDIYVSAVNEIGQGTPATTTVTIPVIPYQLEIGGVMVTKENMNDVLSDGTVSYDPASTTLTLNNAHINVPEGDYGIRSQTRLTLKLIGENSISCSGVYGFHSTDDVNVIGSGSLDVTANDVGIYIAGGYEVGGLYLHDDVTLNVTSGNVASGNSYGVRVDDVLEVRENATLIAKAGTAPERSCGIYAYDELNVYDNAVVTATGANQSVDLNTDCDGIRATHITIEGGTVTATGGKAATTNGIFTQTFEMNGGTLTAVSGSTTGGTCFGPSTALQATKLFKMTDGVINATSGSAGNDTSCGIWVSNGKLQVEDGSLYAESGEANFSCGIKASELFLNGGYISAESAEGTWCSNGISVENNLFVGGGDIVATAHDAETYSYGLQAYEMTFTDGNISASAGSAANSYGLWAFGNIEIFCNNISPNPYVPGFIGTKVTASAESGYAVYSRTGVEIADQLTISVPEDGSIATFGTVEDFTAYYTAVDADGIAAETVKIDVLTYDVSIEGLDIGYDMVVEVPAGWSVNETYSEKYGVEDFSEILPITKDGYTFHGWRTETGSTFTFATAVTSDVIIYAQWRSNSSGGSSSNTTSETTKNEDGSTTTTTTNKNTGAVSETTKNPDGTTGTVVTDKNGNVTEVSAKVPANAAKNAEKFGDAVKLPVQMEATKNSEDAQEIKIDVPTGGVTLEIPVEDVTPGIVVVIVNKDGTEEIVKSSTVSEDGVIVTLEKDSTIKVIDNSKDFSDVAGSFWAGDPIDFVTAREIFSGTSATTFTPDGSMTRQAMWMVLARMSNEELVDMAEAKAWAVENGISDGSDPTNAVTRQQFVTMLWRWHGKPESDHSVDHHTDAHTISNYADEAVAWAVEHGIKGGYDDGTLRPHGTATRAHVATFIQRFYENVVQ